ncbi:thioesterase YiiD [Gottschalkia acidurici 9a]|uniref:Thioesterase YiiD n=1 Tax=Gottschalkia acidurici (strain ATCC 7906 / DSM 604 / BCRC 14475 / CIP 104303 / KCTC 5404 / NCIMB 10678 / 9a) TaxID=1128398 RepID=K0AYL4_GOTA9|nr:YiiD C-terminal domain-containing protein [Gottschalkia acidurici]AFS77496.1 thioesterase YiiD [Gottschalkia acidurici 9a]
MNKGEFEEFLYQQIPITKEMGFNILEFTQSKVRISARLEPNINHKSTAFGGSINSLMTVCGWALVFKNIKEIDPYAHIVIQKSNINYVQPIREDFVAECSLTDEESKRKFLNMYERHKKSRININVYCYKQETLLAEYEGQYVVFR